jgi:hypothetical protein
MKRLASILASALIALTVAPASQAAFEVENFNSVFTNEDGSPATQAGSHPFAMTTGFDVSTKLDPKLAKLMPDGDVKNLRVEFPRGFTGSPLTTPRCATADFLTMNEQLTGTNCQDSAAVGASRARILDFGLPGFAAPVYSLTPPPGVVVKLGFWVNNVPVIIHVGVDRDPPYNVVSNLINIPQVVEFYGGKLELWGVPANSAHDPLRGSCLGLGFRGTFDKFESVGICETNIPEVPFLTLPRSCTGPLVTNYEADSWQEPGNILFGGFLSHDDAEPPNPQGMTGCSKVGFNPTINSRATTASAETGTGLDFSVDFHDEGLTNPDLGAVAQSEIKKAVVTLPEGMTINPSVGEGLGVCTPSDLDKETVNSAPGGGCPNNSKLGSVHLETPLVEEGIDGSVFLAEQDNPETSEPGAENPFDSLLAMYVVLKNPTLGLIVKQPAKIEPDPVTGQLVTTFEDVPQQPFSRFDFHFREGARAPLVTPPSCGTYEAKAEFTPWANPDQVLTTTSSFKVTSGIGGGPCPPGGIPPFDPDYQAGSINNNAKSYSPFYMRLIRKDGDQDMTKFSSVLPPGVLGKLAGVSKCPDAAIEAAKSKTGRQELRSPSCPANSNIGHSLAGAGVGGALTYVGGQIYLGGPYKGDPLSVISITPAVAGPFDAGTVVVRLALTLNPETAEVEVDGAASDPIPHILKGIVLKVRDIRVYVDRPEFIINPTSCDPSSAKATLFGGFLDVFSPADDQPADLSTRYQAANCLNLGFKPKLKFRLKGGTKRGDHPSLRAELKARPGDANIGKATVTLPKSAFLDQSHIRTICTRVQFAAKNCPKGAEYGFAKAWTPLLDEPIEGPVYLRSSNNKLPDLVIALRGLVDVNVSSRIDSKNGGIRNSFETIPDAPVTKFVLTLQGGKKGLVVNSRNLCSKPSRADARFVGQNGIAYNFRPLLKPSCGGKGKKAK